MRITDLLVIMAALLWIGALGAAILISMQAARGQKVANSRVILLGVLAAAVIMTVLSAGLVFIEPQERGVVISALSSKGYRDTILQPGLRFVIPFLERVELYPISRQTYTMTIAENDIEMYAGDAITARTEDGQEIFVDASVIFQVDPEKVVDVHIQWQKRYIDELVRAQSRGIIRDAVSQFKIDDVISAKRFDLVEYVTQRMEEKLSDNGLILVDFVLRNITFSPEYAASVEQKQIAEQQAKQAAYVVESKRQEAQQAIETAKGQAESAIIKAEGEAKARLIQAQAESDALKLIQDALANNPELLTYEYISKLAPNITTMLLPSNQPFYFQIPNLNP